MSANIEMPIAVPVATTYDDELNALLEEEKQLAEKKKQLILKKQLGSPEFQKQLLMKVKDDLLEEKGFIEKRITKGEEYIENLKKEIETWEGKIEKWETEKEEIDEKVEAIEGIDFDEDDIEDFIAENFKEEATEYIESQEKQKRTLQEEIDNQIQKSKAKKATAKKSAPKTDNASVSSLSSTESKSRKAPVITKTMKPAERWAIIPEGSLFRAKHKEVVRYYKKVVNGELRDCDKQGNIKDNSALYKGNQEAANAFKIIAGIDYSISGWEFLQLYNKETDKAKSLKKWNGEPAYLLW